jgi:hypothetical protein
MRPYSSETIQGDSGVKVNILGAYSIGHCNRNIYMYMCPILNGYRDEIFESIHTKAAGMVIKKEKLLTVNFILILT